MTAIVVGLAIFVALHLMKQAVLMAASILLLLLNLADRAPLVFPIGALVVTIVGIQLLSAGAQPL